jgi:hypothetical protein
LQPRFAAQGLQPRFAAQGLQPRLAAHGLQPRFAAQGLQARFAAHGLQPRLAAQGLQARFAAQGLQPRFAAHGPAATCCSARASGAAGIITIATPAANASGITVEVSSRVFMGLIFSSIEFYRTLCCVSACLARVSDFAFLP